MAPTLILRLIREDKTGTRVIGKLYRDGEFECYTLEDPEPSGIRAGTYSVVLTDSPRFHRPLPLVVGVSGRTGIRIHAGNTAEDTAGCILVGRSRGTDSILESRAALDALLDHSTWPAQLTVEG